MLHGSVLPGSLCRQRPHCQPAPRPLCPLTGRPATGCAEPAGGSGLSGHDIGAVTAATFGGCDALGSLALKVTAGNVPWPISFASYNAKLDVVGGTVGGVKVTLAGACGAVVNGTSAAAADGTVSAIYRDGIGQLTLLGSGGNLHYWHVTKGCGDLINDGDPVTLTASYAVRPVQSFTSP